PPAGPGRAGLVGGPQASGVGLPGRVAGSGRLRSGPAVLQAGVPHPRGGASARARPGKQLAPPDLKRLPRDWNRRTEGRLALLFDGIQSPFNVGAITRTSA